MGKQSESKSRLCPACGGSGSVKGKRCAKCGGTGFSKQSSEASVPATSREE